MTPNIKPNKPPIQPKPEINIQTETPPKTPLFCFCHIARDKESREILKDKIKCKDFLDSIMTISELKIIEEIKKHKGLNFEPLEKPIHSVRVSNEYRTIFHFQDMKFILKSIKHKSKYKNHKIR